MRYGVCTNIDKYKLEKLKGYGYDYVELQLCNIFNMTDEEVEDFRKECDRTGMYVEAVNFFFPYGGGYLVKPGIDFGEIEKYLHVALSKAQRLGTKVAVIGSGGARTIPDDVKWEDGEAQFAKVLAFSGEIAKQYGIEVVIEPLFTGNSNFIHTVAEGIDICKKANHPNVFVLADFFHVFMSGESLETIENCGDMLRHVHIARANADRQMPIFPEDKPYCEAWAKALKKNGYNGRISLEGAIGEDWDGTIIKTREALKVFD